MDGQKMRSMSDRYIYLKNGDEVVKQEKFSGQYKRRKIIEKWKALYGKKFFDLTITEDPEEKKETKKKSKTGKLAYGTILVNRNKGGIRKNFNRNFNGYKD